MLSKSLFSSTKKLYKPVVLQLNSTFCYINGFLMNISLKLKVNSILILKKFSNLKKKRFNSNQSFILLINKKFINTFFSFLFQSLDGISHGFKITLYIKGKGLRIHLKLEKINYVFILNSVTVIKFFYIYPQIVGLKFLDDDVLCPFFLLIILF